MVVFITSANLLLGYYIEAECDRFLSTAWYEKQTSPYGSRSTRFRLTGLWGRTSCYRFAASGRRYTDGRDRPLETVFFIQTLGSPPVVLSRFAYSHVSFTSN